MSCILPFEDWPTQDKALWEALYRAGGPLDDRGPLAHLRATSIAGLFDGYGRWLGWLSKTDPGALALPPAERADMLRLRAWLTDLAHTKSMTQCCFIDRLVRVLRAAAPERDWTDQLTLQRQLKNAAGTGDPARKRGRIVSSRVLLELGIALATDEADAAATSLEALKRRRDGTMIALLALMPMRRRSFAELRLGTSVLIEDAAIVIALTEEMTKTAQPWEAHVPTEIAPLLRNYIDTVRPALLARGGQLHDQLWVGKKGEPIQASTIGQRIGLVTSQHLGVRVSAHLFRDAAATTLARTTPQAARLIRPVLGHRSFQTAERHYNHAQTIEAGRAYADLIRKKKDRSA